MSKPLPPLSELQRRWQYDPATGAIHHYGIVLKSKRQGYLVVVYKKKMYYQHRLAFLYMTGKDPGDKQVDHINQIKDDNRWENLRLVTNEQNAWNRSMASKGYQEINGRFYPTISFKGKKLSLGGYDTAEEATHVYLCKARELRGEYFPG